MTADGTAAAERFQDKVAGVCLIVGALLWAPTAYFDYSTGLFASGAIGLLLYILLIPVRKTKVRHLLPADKEISSYRLACGCSRPLWHRALAAADLYRWPYRGTR